jgi:hypothetical protein
LESADRLESLACRHKETILECIKSKQWIRIKGDGKELCLENHTLWAGYTAVEQASSAAEKQGYATSYEGKLYSSIKREEFDSPPPKRMVFNSGCKDNVKLAFRIQAPPRAMWSSVGRSEEPQRFYPCNVAFYHRLGSEEDAPEGSNQSENTNDSRPTRQSSAATRSLTDAHRGGKVARNDNSIYPSIKELI